MISNRTSFIHNTEQRIFFTSDTHFNHNQPFIFNARGYNSITEHNDSLINKINELIRPQDLLFHLGDFCLNSSISEFESFIERIHCSNIYYIWGNHNSCIKTLYEESIKLEYQKEIEVYPYKVGKITYLGFYNEILINGQLVILHHYPHQVFNGMKKESWQLSGHSHYNNPNTRIENPMKILDVGWDGHHKPLSFNEIQKIMSNKKFLVDTFQKT